MTSLNVSFCAYKSTPTAVSVLPEDQSVTPDAVITTPANADDIQARLNTPVTNEVTDSANATTPVIIVPSNAEESSVTVSNHVYAAGAKVEVNWRSHGEYYPTLVTGVHKAGANGSRTTYDVAYESDGEAERRVGSCQIRPRSNANVAIPEPCGHALMTDCNPTYLADVPDLARTHVTPTNYGRATRGPEREHWIKSMQEELESL